MFEFLRVYQLDIMLILCGSCGILTLLLLFTRFLSVRRKTILILMEIIALFLLWFDRQAYIYAGVTGLKGYVMVRVSNLLVFFLTPAIVFGFNLYLTDWLLTEGKLPSVPKRLKAVAYMSITGMVLAIVSALTDLYYYFDANNTYHRGQFFLIAYIIPFVCPLIQYTVIREYKKVFSKLIYASLALYIFVPILFAAIQIFAYGLSLVNMSMVLVSISLYIFTYLDINNEVIRAHNIEMENMQGENLKLQRLFYQTATSFVSAIEKKDERVKGTSIMTAEFARRLAVNAHKSEEECDMVYYAALLHDVGRIGVPDSVIANEDDPNPYEEEVLKQMPAIGREILSSITEFPYLAQSAYSLREKYDGTGYPEGLKGEEIPEISRIIAVADAYISMTTSSKGHSALPDFVIREAFIKGAGESFDPTYANLMVKLIDSDTDISASEDNYSVESELTCKEYRDTVSIGIPVEGEERKITFKSSCNLDKDDGFSAPSLILFDSYDRRIHKDEKTINVYKYLEYGELWFDDNIISTAARKIEVRNVTKKDVSDTDIKNPDRISDYEITAGRFEDHVKIVMSGPECTKEIIIALFDRSRSFYIGLTGENCDIRNIKVETTGKTLGIDDIPRIADEISYIDHLESDINNVQIDHTRSASTVGIRLSQRLKLNFHTMSLPGANLIWQCPYIVLFHSKDGQVNGPAYHEYALIKLNGENEGHFKHSQNRFKMKKGDDFPGWETWRQKNKRGLEVEVLFEKRGNRITTRTTNLGIDIDNITTIEEDVDNVYVAITGDQVALTDIRIKRR